MATLDDILSTQKNGVQAINNLSQVTSITIGTTTNLEISAATLVKNKAGWIAKISVIVAGSTDGVVYDATSTATAGVGNRLFIIPTATTAGTILNVSMPTSNGIVVTPGTGMIVSVSYS
jgi:hypothetical protein